mmetsp:Transcript_53611/g.130577  ORF Transcript_53611/g.130577 Transcript_53611/m.130577 type:complete len:621 (-) Transcript_53611:1007-2869(-)
MEMTADRGQLNHPPPHDHQHRRARSIGSSVLSSQLFQAVRVVALEADGNGHTSSHNNTSITTNASKHTSDQANIDPLTGMVVETNATSNSENRSQGLLPAQQQQRETMLSVLISAYQVRWRAVEERLATHPAEATILDCEGRSVLYRALSRRPGDYPPVRVVRKILQISPRSIWERHSNKTATTLIEMACWRRASLETLEVLTAGRPSIPEDAPSILALWKAYVELHGGDESSLIEFLRSTNIENARSNNNDTTETDSISSSSEDDRDMEGPDHDDHGGSNNNNNNNVENGGNLNETESFIVGCKFHLILKYLTTEQMRQCSVESALSSPHCSFELFKIFIESLGSSTTSSEAVIPGKDMDMDRRNDTILFTKKVEYLKERMQHHDQKIEDRTNSPITKRQKPDLVTTNHLVSTKGKVGIGAQPVWISPELETILDRIDTASTTDTHTKNELYGQFVATIRTSVNPSWHQLIGAAQVLHCPLSLMRILIDLHPEKLLHADEQGWLPLHHAIARPSKDDILSVILESCPESCRHRDGHGRLPFHLACLSGKSIRVLSELQKYLPKSIEENDPVLRLPPALLAAQSDRTSVCNVFHLLRSSPDVVCGKSLEKNLTYDIRMAL